MRLVVFTSGPLLPINRVLFERLSKDALIDLSAIIVDEYREPMSDSWHRFLRTLRNDGWRWFWFSICSRFTALSNRVFQFFFELAHPPRYRDESYEDLEHKIGVRIIRVPDIHSQQSLAIVKSLQPQLGVIVGGGILGEPIISMPEYGTLNLQKRKIADHRGGGPVGYWEVLAGETSIGITIHFATSQADAGPIVAEATIPIEECDTLESLRIKADILGAEMYLEAIRRIALGFRAEAPQDLSSGRTFRSPSSLEYSRLEKRLKRKALKTIPFLRSRPGRVITIRLFLQYVLVLPLLFHTRNKLLKQHRAPICIFFCHVVANNPLNHICMPLELFVKEIEFLRRYFALISLDEAVERLNSGKNDLIAASITFDDGYKDNVWAIRYLRYFGVPASFFMSVGHVRDGSPFEHDLQHGFKDAPPMNEADVRMLVVNGFTVGSHGIHHEEFDTIDLTTADRVLRDSRKLIGQVCGEEPEHFSFPKGRSTAESLTQAHRYYSYTYGANGGHNLPSRGRRYFFREANPFDILGMAMIMDGYTGFRECLVGNAWSLKTHRLSFDSAGSGEAARPPAFEGLRPSDDNH